MADANHNLWPHLWELLWQVVNVLSLGALGLFGWMLRRYWRDRKTLGELKRKMEELDDIRAKTEDGQLALDRLDDTQRMLDEVAESVVRINQRLDKLDEDHHESAVVLAVIQTDVRWIRAEMDRA